MAPYRSRTPGPPPLAATTTSSTGAISKEVIAKQVQWERQIGNLDEEEMVFYNRQFKLIREQMATFIRELAAMRETTTANGARITYLGMILEDSASQQDQNFEGSQATKAMTCPACGNHYMDDSSSAECVGSSAGCLGNADQSGSASTISNHAGGLGGKT